MSRSGGSRDASATAELYCEIDGMPVSLLAEDLSTVGFFIQTTTPYALDRELEIFIRSCVGELEALGQVVQVVDRGRASQERRRPGFGLLFTSLEDDQRAFIGLTLDAIERSRPKPQPNPVAKEQPPAPKATPIPVAVVAAKVSAQTDPAQLKQIGTELRAELTKLQGKTAWTALGLEADAPLESAKEAFLQISKRFHPHKFARHNSHEITKLATEVFIAYKRSYSVLTKLAPRSSSTSLPKTPRAPTRPLTSIAPASPAAENQPPAPSGRTRSRSR